VKQKTEDKMAGLETRSRGQDLGQEISGLLYFGDDLIQGDEGVGAREGPLSETADSGSEGEDQDMEVEVLHRVEWRPGEPGHHILSLPDLQLRDHPLHELLHVLQDGKVGCRDVGTAGDVDLGDNKQVVLGSRT